MKAFAYGLLAMWSCLGPTAPALADVYGYVDDRGVTHLATEKLDEHYALFLKTAGDGGASVEDTNRAPDQKLMQTRLFKRLINQPNIARYEPMIRAASARHGLDPQLIKAVVAVESGFEAGATSDKGAIGLMQVLPATGERYGVRADRRKSIDEKLTDPVLNLEIGTRYLSDLRKMFVGRPDLALAAYNAGENAVAHYRNTIPPFPETQAYVKLVDQFEAFYAPPAAKAAKATTEANRIRVVIPARRNLPDPNVPWRVPAPPKEPDATGSVLVPASAADDTTKPAIP